MTSGSGASPREPSTALPTAAVVLATLLWGTAWLPMRYLKSRGLDTDWALVEIFAAVVIALTPAIVIVRSRMVGHWASLAVAGLTGGVAMTAYYLSVTQTTVARATLLFYLAPVWTTLIEMALTRKRPHPTTFVEIALSLAGLAVIVGPTGVGDHGVNLGDMLAGFAGLAFACSSVVMARWPQPGGVGFTWAWAIGSLVSAGMGSLLLDLDGLRIAYACRLWAPVLATALLMFMPMNILALWGARQLNPTKVSLLMTCEVIVATVSSALFANDPIGSREILGCALILLATAFQPCRLLARRIPARLAPSSTRLAPLRRKEPLSPPVD